MAPHLPSFQPDANLFPFTSRWFEHPEARVHFIDEGIGPPLLFLHGNPTWSFLYRGIVVRLRDRFRCIALDLPGFGLSERPDGYGYTPAEHATVVRDFVRDLDLRNLTIMGQDWGGPIGLRVAADEITRLRALVMGNTWYWPVTDWHMKAFAYAMGSAPVQKLIFDRNFFVEQVMPRAVRHPLAPEVREHYREGQSTRAGRRGVAEFPKQILAAAAWLGDLEDEVRSTLANVPLLLTWGVHDFAFPSRYIDRFRDDFATVTVERLDAKHYIQEDCPAEIADAIARFLEG